MLTETQLLNLETFTPTKEGFINNDNTILLKPVTKKRTVWKMFIYSESENDFFDFDVVDSLDKLDDYYYNITYKNLI